MNAYDPNQDQRTQLLQQLAALGGSGTGAPTPGLPPAYSPTQPQTPTLPNAGGSSNGGIIGPNVPGYGPNGTYGGIVGPQGPQGMPPPMPNMPPPAGPNGTPPPPPGSGPVVTPPAGAAPPALGAPPPGFDAGKWADPNKHDPKYDVGRLLQGAAGPGGLTSAGVQSQLDAINQLYPGTTFDGKDVLTIPGYGPIHVIQGLGTGHGTTAWQPVGQGGSSGGGKTMPTAALQSLVGGGGGLTGGLAGALSGGDVTSQILAEINGLMGGNGSSLTRDALLNKLGVQSPSGGQ